MLRARLGILALISAEGLTSEAHSSPEAQPAPEDQARQLFAQGVTLFDQKNFEQARILFQQSYSLVPRPNTLFNLAWATLRAGADLQAHLLFTEYLHVASDGLTEQDRRWVENALRSIDSRISRLRVNATEDGATIWVDERELGKSPLVDVVRVIPGPHQVRAARETREAALHVQAHPGEQLTVLLQLRDLTLPPAPAPPPKVVLASRPWHRNPWFWGTAAAAAVGITATIVVLSAASEPDRREDVFQTPIP